MAAFGFFLASVVVFSTIWYAVLRKIAKKAGIYQEYKHGEVRRWDE